MPRHTATIIIARPAEEVFALLTTPALLAQMAPPELSLQLVKAPERLQLGSLVHWKARRMGISRSLVNEVTGHEENALLVSTQREGPFAKWVFTHRLDSGDGGTQLHEELEYAPPTGLLGLMVTEAVMRRDVETLFAFRARKFAELFA
jgi:ligand-binding SRPBCC domain-containing protein